MPGLQLWLEAIDALPSVVFLFSFGCIAVVFWMGDKLRREYKR